MWFVEIIRIKEWKRFTQKSQIISLVVKIFPDTFKLISIRNIVFKSKLAETR
jgi:hypothetical protein